MLSLNAVGKMYDLPQVNKDISKVLNVASFTEGNSYFDFDPKVDHVAAWTIGAWFKRKLGRKKDNDIQEYHSSGPDEEAQLSSNDEGHSVADAGGIP
jgi:hypothetical protein